MSHDEAYDLIESYAFGTLEPDQTAELEKHLDTGCDLCLARLRDAGELSVCLAGGLPQHDPPASVELRLMSAIKAQSGEKYQPSRRGVRLPVWSLAVAAIVVIALISSQIVLSIQKRTLKRQLVDASDVTSLLNSPGMKFVDLKGVDPNPQAFGKVVMDPKKGAAVVYMYKLPQTPEGMQYQLWVMRQGKPTSAGLFTVTPDGSAMLALKELDDPSKIGSFLVTIEPEGGQAAPTGMMYLTGPNKIGQEN